MAQRQIVVLSDDLTGEESEDVTPNVTFSFLGSDYEIDLNDANFEALKKALAPYMEKGRRIKRSRKGSAAATSTAGRSASSDSAKIRAWAKENGYDVNERGRIPADVYEAYRKAN